MTESNLFKLFQSSNFKEAPVKFLGPKEVVICSQDKGQITVTVPNTSDFLDAVEHSYGARVILQLFPPDSRTYSTFKVDNWFAIEFYAIVADISAEGMMTNTCKKILDSLKKDTWLKNTVKPPKKKHLNMSLVPKQLKWPLLEHQEEYMNWYNNKVRSYGLIGNLMGFTMGGGKTMTSIAVAVASKAERMIVLCPKPAVPSPWIKIHGKIFREKPSLWHTNLKTELKEDDWMVVANFDYLEKLIIKLEEFPPIRTTIILDESHNFNTQDTRRTIQFDRLVKLCKPTDVLFLTGTPIKARHMELITLFRAIDPFFTPEVEEKFLTFYKLLRGKMYGLLSRRLGVNSFIVEKKTLNLTDSTTKEIHLEVKNGDRYTMEHVKERMVKYSKKRI